MPEFGEYTQDARTMASIIGEFADSGLLNIVGGCCGTTPEHIRSIAARVSGVAPRQLPQIAPAMRQQQVGGLQQQGDLLPRPCDVCQRPTQSVGLKRVHLQDLRDQRAGRPRLKMPLWSLRPWQR